MVKPTIAAVESRADTTSFYEVPMICPVVRGLGCGSIAKPVLLALENAPTVKEAWLEHRGQVLTIIWTSCSTADDRSATLTAICEEHDISMEELTGSARQNALQSFGRSGSCYRGLEVDHLSELEANVVADRILARLVNFMPTARKKVEILKPMAVDLIRHFLVDIESSDDWQSRFRRDILVKAHQHLSKQELSALRDAIGLGLRAVGDEQ